MHKSLPDHAIRRRIEAPGAALLARFAPLADDVPDLRVPLHAGGVGTVTLLSVSAPNASPTGYNSHFQVALPIVGLFTWAVGRTRTIVDANTALFISAGQDYAETHPIAGLGHACALIDPCPHIVEEMRALRALGPSDPFEAVTRTASARGQMLAHRLMRLSAEQANAGDELIVAFLLELARADAPPPSRAPRKVVAKAKEFIHELRGRKLSLDAAATAIGVSPIYLTQTFKASEGIPLYRHYLNVRLSQALGQLPHCPSITNLALELGFSSHSHFSAAFFARFGVSPSEYREMSRAQRNTGGFERLSPR